MLTLCLACCVAVSVHTLKRALRVLASVRRRDPSGRSERAALLWSLTQVRIEWCILAAQCLTLGLSLHRITTTLWDESRLSMVFHVYGTLRVIVAALLAWCMLENKRTCERLQSMP
jgi:integral membrane sensor domain MASE1